MKSSLIICITILLSFSSIAQDNPKIPKWHFKYNFTSLLDLYAPLVQLSVEYPIAKGISVENELGWATNRIERLFGVGQNFSGVRTRNQLHFFFPEDSDIFNYTFDLHLVGRYIFFPTQEYEYSRYNGAFFQKFEASPRYYDIGFLIGGSVIAYLRNAPISFEISTALGTKRSFISEGDNGNLPEDAIISSALDLEVNILPPLNDIDRRHLICLINIKMGVFFNQSIKNTRP